MENETNAKLLLEQISRQKRALTVWCSISLGLLAFLVICVSLIISWTGELSDIGPFLLLGLMDIPLLIGTWKCYQRYRQLKKEEVSLCQQDTPSGDYVQNRKLLEREQQLKLSMYTLPIVLVFCLLNDYGIFLALVCVVCLLINLRNMKKVKAQIQESGITQQERDAFAAESKKGNKTKGTIALVILLLALIIATALDSGSGSSSGKPWKELDVSEKEYMDIYYKFKYGE